jgi:hypothetical protein
MTAPSTPNVADAADALRHRRKRRRLALAGVLSVIVAAALLTPEMIGGRSGDSRLTTYSAEPQGARLLYELASRLGWHVERWTQSGTVDPDPRTVVAVLDPVQPIGAIEAHRLLERVRAGSGLLYVMSGTSPLNDSLHVKRSLFGGIYEATAAGTAESPRVRSPTDTLKARHFASAGDSSRVDDEVEEPAAECAHVDASGGALPLWGDQKVHLFRFSWTGARPSGTVVFARSAVEEGQRDTTARVSAIAAAGFPVGRGRVVLLSDADVIRNDVIRVCRWGLDVATARMLEYLAAGDVRRDRLIFDEYHQGFGTHPGTLRTVVVYLSRAASGHVLIQALLGGLVLLLALGPRALPVNDPERVERGGRGEGNLSAAESDARFLDNVAANPALTDDVALIRRGLFHPLSRREFEDVGSALQRVEQSFLTQRR